MSMISPATIDGADVSADPRIDTEVAARLRLVLGRVGRRIRLDTEFGLPPLQNAALATISHHGPLRLGELAAREGVSAPTMSRVLAALEERGLVDRRPDPQDARSVLLSLNAAGEATLQQIRSAHTAVMVGLLQRLDTDQLAVLMEALPVLEELVTIDSPATGRQGVVEEPPKA